MAWEELYPIVADQVYWSVMLNDLRRKEKIQELVCQSYEKYQRDVADPIPICLPSPSYPK